MYALSTIKKVIGMNSQTCGYVNDAKVQMYVHAEGRDCFLTRLRETPPTGKE